MSDMLILFLIIAVALWLHIASNWGYWPMRKCPSGKPHRVVVGTVKNYLGREWCWHKDCMREALQERVHDLEILIDVKSEDLDEATAKVRELQRQVAELEADARRYRWLRENLHPDHFCAYMHYQPSDALLWKRDAIDAAIDAAIAALNKETTG